MDSNRVEVAQLARHVWLVGLVGEHDPTTAQDVRAAVDRVYAAGSSLVLDLSEATFIDSSVLAAIMAAQAEADAHVEDELVVVAPSGSPADRLLELVGVGGSVRICGTRAAAIEELTYR